MMEEVTTLPALIRYNKRHARLSVRACRCSVGESYLQGYSLKLKKEAVYNLYLSFLVSSC